MKYVRIDSVPDGLRFDVPPQNQGQMVEIAYADERPHADEACHGSRYKRIHDRSDNTTAYYVRSGK